jgi:hypothetical protein
LAAERDFVSGESDFDLEIGSTRKWAFGFFDGTTGAFSNDMELRLQNSEVE